MTAHPMLPGVVLDFGFSHSAFERYLREWREQAISAADDGVTAASVCHQAVLIDLVLFGQLRHDWLSVMQDILTDAGRPVAYSSDYGKRLHKFGGQWLQSTVHSIHTRWWVETLSKPVSVDHDYFAKLILDKKRADGLIYDMDVSATTLRHRMKAELSMSAVMGAEILSKAGHLTDALCNELATSLCDPLKVPPLGYMTSEQFRLAALRILRHEEQFPTGIGEHIMACAEGLQHGWGDFPIASKVDAYMGTAKRIARDKPIHSPLVACHISVLAEKVDDPARQAAILDRLTDYALSLAQNPLDIPAFQMRDVPIPFGADLTPIEAVCASSLINNLCTEEA
ncbi:hypothetical protein RIE95_09660 [Acidithiobacillus thiooxidans]|uniref:hypothetical protein n=1 Tax=Acidithiobacillus thiooxidans TaxID=930 RepID=UPI002856E69C|nr:hypothetical protein [Acidithiobacillus thiooxidans]MDR7927244.1 hypothetical protein [Acidithiobacillus thiooxidans]